MSASTQTPYSEADNARRFEEALALRQKNIDLLAHHMATKKHADEQFHALRTELLEAYGTDDPEKLRALYKKMMVERNQKMEDFIENTQRTHAGLTRINTELSDVNEGPSP